MSRRRSDGRLAGRRLLAPLAAAAVAAAASACSLTSPRQTLADLDDGRSVYAEGRRDVCLHLESADDEVEASACDLVEDPLHVTEYAAFGRETGAVLVGIAPLDVTTVEVDVEGETREAETIASDLTTGFYVIELPPGIDHATVRGFDASGEPIGEPLLVEVPAPGATTSASTPDA